MSCNYNQHTQFLKGTEFSIPKFSPYNVLFYINYVLRLVSRTKKSGVICGSLKARKIIFSYHQLTKGWCDYKDLAKNKSSIHFERK